MSPNTHLSESGRGTWAPRVSSRAEDREGGPPAPAPASAASTWDRARDEIVRGGHRGGLLLVAILGLGYLALAQFVLWTNDPAQVGMNFWPAAGLTLGTLLLLPTRRWAWALAAIALAEITSDVIKGHPASVLIWLTIADTTEPLIGATLVRGFTRHRGALVPVRGLVEFVAFAVIAAPIAGSALGTIGTTMAGEGVLTTSWNGDEAKRLAAGEVVFGLTFKANRSGRLSDLISVNSRYTAAEAYSADNQLLNVALSFDGAKVAGGFELYQNTPNPFAASTAIGFYLPEATSATLTISDVQGKVLRVVEGDYTKGYHQVDLKRGELNASGVLYYRLDTGTDSATRKMILVD